MTPILIVAIILMFSALGLYTVGVWSEKIAGRLKGWHLIFFWLGFAADTAGTTLMGRIAGSFSVNLHSITGIAAILLMLIHAGWATAVLLRNDQETAVKFHKFSILVWAIWLFPFISGLVLAMAPSFSLANLAVSPAIHMGIGSLALLATLVSLAAAGWLAWKKRPISSWISRVFIVAQLALMAQVLVGLKLLDQGFAQSQVYLHYVGGMAPIAFFLLFYWLRTTDKVKETRVATAVTGFAFLFVLVTFAIGSMAG